MAGLNTPALTPQQQFHLLDDLLLEFAWLWRPVPFQLPRLPWESSVPGLATALRGLPDATLAELEADPAALLSWLANWLPDIDRVGPLLAVPALAAAPHPYPSGFHRDIPGRKWQQVRAFAAAVDALPGTVLEWCSGKGHLGRTLHHRLGVPVTGLEWNPELCREGNALSARQDTAVRIYHCDVLGAEAIAHLAQAGQVVALHACGDLHRRLLEALGECRTAGVYLSPCCYHLGAQPDYRAFSRRGRDSALAPRHEELRLAVQETVTAGAATTRSRNRRSAWRLGFDALQRQLRGSDTYLPVPSMPEAAFRGEFRDFCRRAANLKGLALPAAMSWDAFEQRGWQRQAEVSRMELPRHAFRRALELWLVLDRALYLQELGYRVGVGTFCAPGVTPRNLLIRAIRETSGAAGY